MRIPLQEKRPNTISKSQIESPLSIISITPSFDTHFIKSSDKFYTFYNTAYPLRLSKSSNNCSGGSLSKVVSRIGGVPGALTYPSLARRIRAAISPPMTSRRIRNNEMTRAITTTHPKAMRPVTISKVGRQDGTLGGK
jgi:hypothetical protein